VAQKTDINQLRNNIDSLDKKLFRLLEDRLNIVKKIVTCKKKDNKDSLVMFPSREAKILQDIIKNNQTSYSQEAVTSIWRNVIFSSVQFQQNTTITVHCDKKNSDNFWLAREHFGSFSQINQVQQSNQVLSDLVDNKTNIGILSIQPNKDPWWTTFVHLSKQKNIHIFAKLPFISDPHIKTTTFAFSNTTPALTNSDISCWIIETKPTIRWISIQDIFNQLDCPITLIDQYDSSFLVSLSGFVSAETDPIINSFLEKSKTLLKRLVYIGGYALPEPTKT
jgi:chorismate mutase